MPPPPTDELRALFTKAKLPTSPALAAQILELAEDPDSTVEQFAEIIQMDPALAARLLRMTNSAAYAQRTPVTSIQRAVALLGLNRVRTVSLGFQLVGHLNRLGNCPFDMKAFWRQSILRACLAREFAEVVVPPCVDEAFLIGLLQDSGILLLVQLLGEPYAELYASAHLSPTAFLSAEKEQFPHNHVNAVVMMGREWKLPETIIRHLAKHHTPTSLTESSSDEDRLSAVSYLVGSLRLANDLKIDAGEPVLKEYAERELGLDNAATLRCFNRAAEAYAEMGQLLRDFVPEDLDVTELLSQANTQLANSMEAERNQTEQEQAHLKSALGEYRERAARDPLTGLLNRGALTEAVRDAVQQARRDGETITVQFLDIDNFKRLNDTLSHPAGDEVLMGVAATLRDCVTNAGIVGRYGGEEFLLVVSGLTEREARDLCQLVVTQVRETRFPELELRGPVTCSLGAVWHTPMEQTVAEGLVARADELMYEAKRSGKNRYAFHILGGVNDAVSPEPEPEPGALEACAAFAEVGAQVSETEVVPAEFERIAKHLNRNTPQRFVDVRKQIRKDLIVPCKLTALRGVMLDFVREDAYVRNISTGGIGVLTARSLLRGQPVEVVVLMNGEPRLFVAGVVAFCRHIEGVIHEVGLQLFTHAKHPILSSDPISAIRNLDWVASALRSITNPASVEV